MAILSLPLIILSFIVSFLYPPVESNNVLIEVDFLNPHPPRVLLLTAHPDDECLFFAPTILSLLQRGAAYHNNAESDGESILTVLAPDVFHLCLSLGNADSLGSLRRTELENSLDILGVHKDKRWVVDNPHLQDNITASWDVNVIAEVIKPFVLEHGITTILTFDFEGVSGHPNHKALPAGVLRMLDTFPVSSGNCSSLPRPRLFTLLSRGTVVKYWGPIDPLLTKINLHLSAGLEYMRPWLRTIENLLGFDLLKPPGLRNVTLSVFVSGIEHYWIAASAMREHWSQMVWFRWLYVLFSRYMWVNEWMEVGSA